MLWVNRDLIEGELAINGLSFYKDGSANGNGSWGFFYLLRNGKDKPIKLFLGLKFNVLSVITDSYTESFINIPKYQEEKVHKLRRANTFSFEAEDLTQYNADEVNSDDLISFVLDDFKLEVDIVEFAKRIYTKVKFLEQFEAMLQSKVLQTRGAKPFREIIAIPTKIFEGNIETMSTLFVGQTSYSVINNRIYFPNEIHPEIRYSVWNIPIDIDYDGALHTNLLRLKSGHLGIVDMGVIDNSSSEDGFSPSFDIRTIRDGYYDIEVVDPFVNIGYRPSKHLYCQDNSAWYTRTIPSSEPRLVGDIPLVVDEFKSLEPIIGLGDRVILKLIADFKIKHGFSLEQDRFFSENIPVLIQAFLSHKKIPWVESTLVERLAKRFEAAYNLPLASRNTLIDIEKQTNMDRNVIIVMYHPVLNEHVFYEAGDNDNSSIEKGSVIFSIKGFRYGICIENGEGKFIWSNIEKPFRAKEKIFLDFHGKEDSVTQKSITCYLDLQYKGSNAYILAIPKTSFRTFVEKSMGVFQGNYILGQKSGTIKLDRNVIWQ